MKPKHILAAAVACLAMLFGVVGYSQTTQPSTQPTTRRAPDSQPAPHPSASWPDHRPIGVVMLSNGGDGKSAEPAARDGFRTAKNPRGWNPYFHRKFVEINGKFYPWGDELDVKGPNYAADFDFAVNWFVQQSFDRAERFGCQGVLFWDVEGSEFDHPITYVGDPTKLPPEMRKARVKAWVEELKRRKMKAGFTFRDTNFVATPYGASQDTSGDPATVLIRKFQDAFWYYGDNVKLAYLDTLVDEDSWVDGEPHPRPAAVLAKVQRSVPGWLVMPEFGSRDYDAVPRVAALRYHSRTGPTPGSLLPSNQAFEVLFPWDGQASTMQRAEYLRAMRSGAITFVTVTWDAPHTTWLPPLAAAAQRP